MNWKITAVSSKGNHSHSTAISLVNHSCMDEDRARYLYIEQMVKRELQDAERVYVNGILQNGLESGNNKPFWKYGKF